VSIATKPAASAKPVAALTWAVGLGALLIAALLFLPAVTVVTESRSFLDGEFSDWGLVLIPAALTVILVAAAHLLRSKPLNLAAAAVGILTGIAGVVAFFRVLSTDAVQGAQAAGFEVSRGIGAWLMIVLGAVTFALSAHALLAQRKQV